MEESLARLKKFVSQLKPEERPAKIVEIAQLLNPELDPKDPEFLKKLLAVIDQLLSQPAEVLSSQLPPNLDQMMEQFQEAEKNLATLKTKIHQQVEMEKEKYARFGPIDPEKLAKRIVDSLPVVAPAGALSREDLQETVSTAFEKVGIKKPPAELVKNLAQAIQPPAQILAKTESITPPPPPKTPAPAVTETDQQVGQAKTNIKKAVTVSLKNFAGAQKLPLAPQETQKISDRTLAIIVTSALAAQGKEINTETVLQATEQFFVGQGKRVNREALTSLAEKIAKENQVYADRIAQASPDSLNEQQRQKLAQLPHPLANPFSPKALLARMIHQVTTPAYKILETAATAEDITPEWQTIIQNQLTPEIIKHSLEVYRKEIGLPNSHPIIETLETWLPVVESQAKTPAGRIIARQARFRWQDEILFLQVQDRYLPLFAPPDLVVAKRPRFSFSYPLRFVFRRTLGRAWQTISQNPLVSKLKIGISRFLAKGLGVQLGVGKVAGWAATKLGFKALLAAIPEPVVSKILLLGSTVLGWVKKFFKNFFEKPELAVIGGLFLVALPIAGPLGLIFKGFGLLSSGIGFLGGAAKWLGSLGTLASKGLAGLAGFASTALGAVTSLSAPAFLPALVPLTLVFLFFFVIFVNTAQTARVFEGEGLGSPLADPGNLVEPRDFDENNHLAENLISILKNECNITTVTPVNFNNVRNCLLNPQNPIIAAYLARFNINALLERFNYSINLPDDYKLQCVGFVRGVMAALGADPGWDGSGDAKAYLNGGWNKNTYQKYTDMGQTQVGDIVVSTYGTYGHMGIVVATTVDRLVVAQAWGPTGKIDIREYVPTVFQGFLRRK